MNVQDVIEKALAGNDGIPVTPVEHSSCEDVQVVKLASALNFIGSNLESSVEELEKLAKEKEDTSGRSKALGAGALAVGAIGAGEGGRRAFMKHRRVKEINEALKNHADLPSRYSRQLGDKVQELKDELPNVTKRRNLYAGGAGLGLLAATYGAKKLYDSRKKNQQKKTASVDDALYHAAQAGKQALLEKVAEDRINPAKISAGPAAPYSGEIMPNAGQVSNEFVGNTRDHHALIALKAQKVRDRINKDMKQYVNNVGDGYNLQGHLNKMNK